MEGGIVLYNGCSCTCVWCFGFEVVHFCQLVGGEWSLQMVLGWFWFYVFVAANEIRPEEEGGVLFQTERSSVL
jgi:hypothetical protein